MILWRGSHSFSVVRESFCRSSVLSSAFPFFLCLDFFTVMAMATSFGKRSVHTKACRIVKIKRANTVAEDMTESTIARPSVIQESATVVYWIEAMAAAVMGNVYAHHAIEKLHTVHTG